MLSFYLSHVFSYWKTLFISRHFVLDRYGLLDSVMCCLKCKHFSELCQALVRSCPFLYFPMCLVLLTYFTCNWSSGPFWDLTMDQGLETLATLAENKMAFIFSSKNCLPFPFNLWNKVNAVTHMYLTDSFVVHHNRHSNKSMTWKIIRT